MKPDSSNNLENISNTKSSWSKQKTYWSNLTSDSSHNVKNTSSNNKSNNKKYITRKGIEDQPWNIKVFQQIKAIEYNHLWFAVAKIQRQEGKGVEHLFAKKRLNTQLQATERAINYH